MKILFENNNLNDVLTHVRELYCISSTYEDLIKSNEEVATLSESKKKDIQEAKELYHFIKNFVETKAGSIPPKSMVIQHRILESLLDKCRFKDAARLNYIGLSYFMNTQNRLKIEEKINSLPF